jgi:hypothetical protein
LFLPEVARIITETTGTQVAYRDLPVAETPGFHWLRPIARVERGCCST